MKIIPVIDLKDGVVVHAQQGNRAYYQPINSHLCQSSDIYQVIKAFLRVYDFDTFYIADLNAITHQGDHDSLINEVLAFFPEKTFWIDKGYQRYKPQIEANRQCVTVLGSECYSDATLSEFKDFNNNFILSLDYSLSEELGAKSLFVDSAYWPETIIIMTLARVGNNQGADLEKLTAFCRQYPKQSFVAAGGIRHVGDLKALKQVGIRQALIASALHSRAIGYAELQEI